MSPLFKKITISSNVLVLIMLSLAGTILLCLISRWVFPYTCDSIIYITTAENIVRLKGLLSTNLFVRPPIPDVLPLSIWPPGYPVCIAILKWIGLNEYAAALFLPRMCFLSLPFLFFSIFKRFIPENVSLIASGICSLTFSVLSCSVIAWSDTPYLALSLLVFIMMFNIIERKTSVHWSYIVWAGFFTACTFLFKYVGLSLITSIGIGLIIGALLKIITLKDLIRMGGLWGLGVSLLIIPFCIRNIFVFGSVGGTLFPVSEGDFFSHMVLVVQLYFQGLSSIIFGTASLAWLIFILITSSLVWFWRRFKDLMQSNKTQFMCLIFLLMYFLINSIFIIYNKSEFILSGNPDVDERVMMQLFWILLAVIIFVVYKGIKRWVPSQGDRRVLAAFLILVFVVVQIKPMVRFYQKQTEIKLLSKEIARYHFDHVPADYVIVSNIPEITYYFAQRNARAVSNFTPFGLLYNLGTHRKFVVFLIKGGGQLSPAWVYGDEWNTPNGYKHVYSDSQVDFFVPDYFLERSLQLNVQTL